MTLASGGSPIFRLGVHLSASPFIRPAVQSLQRDLSTIPGVTIWSVFGYSLIDHVCGVCDDIVCHELNYFTSSSESLVGASHCMNVSLRYLELKHALISLVLICTLSISVLADSLFIINATPL